MTLAEQLAYAEQALGRATHNGKFWAGLVEFYDQSAAKWEEHTGQRSIREAGWLEADDMVEACKLEWKRAAVKVRDLKAAISSPHGSEREAA